MDVLLQSSDYRTSSGTGLPLKVVEIENLATQLLDLTLHSKDVAFTALSGLKEHRLTCPRRVDIGPCDYPV